MTMAESIAEPYVSFVVRSLGNLLIQEAKFLGGVRGQVQQMQIELNRMQCFLKDADARREEGDESVRNWVAEIREAAYDAEDLIQTFVVKVTFKRRSTGILNVLIKYSCVVKDCIALHRVGLEIESIKTKISSITTSLQTYGIRATREGESSRNERRRRQIRQSYPHIMEEDIVGIDEDLKTLVKNLLKEEREFRLVSIWGMGGLGKTTLAKMVYNHSDVRRHFDCFAWAYISQQCNTRDVLEGILVKLISASLDERKEIKEMKHDEVVKKLYEVQSEKKCLVILDDIWKAEDWDSLSPAFPQKKVASKILLTTRKREVASYVDKKCFLHELKPLTEVESWELFEKKASLKRSTDTEFGAGTEMMDLGKEMVRHCGGLPLAIVVLGGIMENKQTLDEWEMVRRGISHYLNKGKGHGGVSITDVLALSYQDLPYHLKACFLYLSNLPEDYGIRPEKLVRMWTAEGIVSSTERKEETTSDVGMSYLGELVQRCMVQVQFTRFSGRIKLCRLHDLMHDFCLLKAQEENFFKIVRLQEPFDHQQLMWADSTSSSLSPLTKIRRLAVYYLSDRDIDSTARGHEITNHRHIRSCQFYFFSNILEGSVWQQIKSLLKGFKLLKVLDLERIKISGEKNSLPTEIGNLIHLRYLSTRDSNIEELPPSIGNLAFLQTLDLRGLFTFRIPDVLWKLEELRHLHLPETELVMPSTGRLRLDGLSKLETLEGFDPSYFDVGCFPGLTNLRKLRVDCASTEEVAVILKSPTLSNSNRLLGDSSFYVSGPFQTEEQQNTLRQLLGCHHLHKLYLYGALNQIKLPERFPPNLTKLTLTESKLEEDPMPTLEKLPKLKSLALEPKAYTGKEMVCSAATRTAPSGVGGGCDGGFPQLKLLRLRGIPNLEAWRVEKGAMPSLFRLEIDGCSKLKAIPDGLRFITTLRELKIRDVSQALLGRVGGRGEDFYKVQHVPSITLLD